MTRTEAIEALASAGIIEGVEEILEILDEALTFDPEIGELSGTARGVAKG